MKIAIVETGAFGGLLHYAVQFGDGLAERGHWVDLITPRGNELVTYRGPARMRAVLTPTISHYSEISMSSAGRFLRRSVLGARLARSWTRVLREVAGGGYDAVVISCDIGLSLPAAALVLLEKLNPTTSVAIVCHNVSPFDRWDGGGLVSGSRILNALLERAYAGADLAFVHGERSRAEFVSGRPEVPVAVIPHGDEQLFASKPPPPAAEERALFFGTWNRVKGIPVLMRAFDELIERRPSARLTIAGSPQPQELDIVALRDWAESHGDRVELIDRYVSIDDVPDLFESAQVVVAPYLIGYQSGVIHLAQTMARAVVASDVGDFDSVVIDEETGLLVPPGDVQALAAAVERLLADAQLANRMGAAGRERMLESSGWDLVAEQAERALLPGVRSRAPSAG